MPIGFGREVCGRGAIAAQREWLVTNGIGGFASGTVAGLLTRRYHGLLIAALQPPLGRTLCVTKFDETLTVADRAYELGCNAWKDGTISPQGYLLLEHFYLDGTIPTWHYVCADGLLEKRIWMEQGQNLTYVQYRLARSSQPIDLSLKALVNYRDYHCVTQAEDWQMQIQPIAQGVLVQAFPGAQPIYLQADRGEAQPEHIWYHDFDLEIERERGLEDREDHLHAVTFQVTLLPGMTYTIVASTSPIDLASIPDAYNRQKNHEQQILSHWRNQNQKRTASNSSCDFETNFAVESLVLAADQFIVDRACGKTILAGYPWFSDWGRDTMISLPGLTLTTGGSEIARSILETYAQSVDRGMIPNRFPDSGDTPEYNTVDATLWYFEAIRAYYEETHDRGLLETLFPTLQEIIDWHVQGTRYNIQRDSIDGLLYAGDNGTQLTWMDAKVGDWVVTPRIGKPIEINALWYNALCVMVQISKILNHSASRYQTWAEQVRTSFQRFWNRETGYCFDVLDTPTGNDASLRPNQLFAITLHNSATLAPLLTPEHQRSIVQICGQHLLTSYGLRSLSPQDPAYQGLYQGNQFQRDGAYHQGTVWGWLMGVYAIAHWQVYGNADQAKQLLRPLLDHRSDAGLGSMSEIFDGNAPFRSRGCLAQAWTVAEWLRAWRMIESSQG